MKVTKEKTKWKETKETPGVKVTKKTKGKETKETPEAKVTKENQG